MYHNRNIERFSETPVPGVGTSDRYERSETDKMMMSKFTPKLCTCAYNNKVTENYIGPRTQYDQELQKLWDTPHKNCKYVRIAEQFNNGLQDPYNTWTYNK